MKKINIINKIKFVILVVVVGLGLNYVNAAFGPTATAPNNNKPNILNTTTAEQSKGGSPIPGSMLDVSGNLAVDTLAVWNNAHLLGNLYIDDLHPSSGTPKVCIDSQHRLETECLMPIAGGGGGGTSWTSLYSCFIADTKIAMADGSYKNIQDVKIGDILKGEKTNNTVLAFHRPLKAEGLIYGFNSQQAFVTEEHPFKTTEGWKSINPEKTRQENIGIEVSQLSVGDILVKEDGLMKIYSIESKDVSESTPLYNFVLTGDRTYFADGYLVHNKNACADWPGYSCIRNSVAPYLLVPPGDPSGNVLPNGCSNIGAIYNQAPTSTPIWMGNCGGSYVYDGCYSGGVNGSIGIRACGNNVPN